MPYLLLILLLFGLIQSLLELKKDSSKKPKWRLERILSIVYIIGFIFGILVIILQDKESTKLNRSISGISFSVPKIDSSSKEQINKLSKSLDQTKSLITETDSLNRNMNEVIKIRDSLTVQTRAINEKLFQQLKLDKRVLKEKGANINLMNYDISWKKIDSTSYQIEACITNLGKRNAIIKSGIGYALFFDKQKAPMFVLDFPGNNNKGILQPNDMQGMRLCYLSYVVHNFQILRSKSDFGVICLKIRYQDVLFQTEEEEYFYVGWIATTDEFGGLRNWQLELAKKWENENHKFK